VKVAALKITITVPKNPSLSRFAALNIQGDDLPRLSSLTAAAQAPGSEISEVASFSWEADWMGKFWLASETALGVSFPRGVLVN
jgi:hypothetical protein